MSEKNEFRLDDNQLEVLQVAAFAAHQSHEHALFLASAIFRLSPSSVKSF